jgi:hypothetical protein
LCLRGQLWHLGLDELGRGRHIVIAAAYPETGREEGQTDEYEFSHVENSLWMIVGRGALFDPGGELRIACRLNWYSFGL